MSRSAAEDVTAMLEERRNCSSGAALCKPYAIGGIINVTLRAFSPKEGGHLEWCRPDKTATKRVKTLDRF
jgi:hypothetical protein